MKNKGILMLMVSLLGFTSAHAQLGNLINKGIKAVKDAKTIKDNVDEVIKKSNNDIDFYYLDKHKGFYRSRNQKIVFDDLHKDGERKGKNAIYTIQKNGDVIFDDGRKVAELRDGGIVNCQGASPYLTLYENGDVVIDNEVVGHIDNAGTVTLEGNVLGKAPKIDKMVAAYIYFGILFDKKGIANVRAKVKEEKLRAEEAQKKAQQEAAARQQAAAASRKNSGSSSAKKTVASNKTTPRKVQEWRIEKGSDRGYVDENGVVYNWSHTKIGQLPNGSGDITDAQGHTIGRISMGDIYDRSGTKVATVSSGGSIADPRTNSTATVAEVCAGGRIDRTKDSQTLGYCDARPYEWAVAIIYCDIFKF